ncbi:MAG: ferric reductase-like transmembrane domain-containing protein [Hyphomicrobiales bacterium]
MRLFGLLIVAAALVCPLIWFVPLTAEYDSSALFSQYLGSAALIVMGISQLLATRFRWLETVFGGLDRIYIIHKWLGVGAIAAVLLHDTIDADIRGTGLETFLSDLAESLGEFSLYALLILVVLSIATFVPYHLWKFTHKFMGALFALSAFHYVFILKPFDVLDPLGFYVLGFCILGIVSYLYTLLPPTWLASKYQYIVRSIERTGGATSITLEPVEKEIHHQAGQFAFINFDVPELRESHPFTISNLPDGNRTLRFTIKVLGDYTARIDNLLQTGVTASVSGPFGHFSQRGKPDVEIWIAAGIGITPFIAWAGNVKFEKPTHLFFCVRDKASAPHLDELIALAQTQPNFHLHLIESALHGRLDAAFIAKTIDMPLKNAKVYFCGPTPMRNALRKGLKELGLRTSKFVYEEFEIRSGLGLRRLLIWILRRLGRSSPKLDALQRALSFQ